MDALVSLLGPLEALMGLLEYLEPLEVQTDEGFCQPGWTEVVNSGRNHFAHRLRNCQFDEFDYQFLLLKFCCQLRTPLLSSFSWHVAHRTHCRGHGGEAAEEEDGPPVARLDDMLAPPVGFLLILARGRGFSNSGKGIGVTNGSVQGTTVSTRLCSKSSSLTVFMTVNNLNSSLTEV